MGNTTDLEMVQKTIIDTLHKESKSQRVITERGGCSRSAASKHFKCKVDWKDGMAAVLRALKKLMFSCFICYFVVLRVGCCLYNCLR